MTRWKRSQGARSDATALLIVHHRGVGPRGSETPEEPYLSEIRRTYRRKAVVGHDLDVY
jgi:hypothetical protein